MHVHSDEQLIPWSDVRTTVTLTVPQVVTLIWAIEGAHQEFCTHGCDCEGLAAPLRAALPDGITT